MPASPAAAGGRTAGKRAPAGQPWVLLALSGAGVCLVASLGVGWSVTVATLALQALFLVFFVRHLAFVAAAARADGGRAELGPADAVPPLTVMVACHDEEQVLDRLVRALLALDYPAGRLQVLLVDDGSTDATPGMLDRWGLADPRVQARHRPPGAGGGKSGALNAALAEATGEVVVVFDADHRPRPDVLRRLARHFADPAVGAVQGRCRILNGGDSLVTALVAIDYLGGYLVNELGRQAVFGLPAYGGACCAVRTSDLRALGGWNEGTVTEDTDLTLRLVLAGRRVRYDVTAVDEEEGVTTLRRYWVQRYRWARGHQQVWRDFRSAVWRSDRLSLVEKLETTLFLLVFHLPALAMAGTGLLLLGLAGYGAADPVLAEATSALWTLLLLGPMLELSTGLLLAGAPRRTALTMIFVLPLFSVSMALCTKAWVDGILGRPYTWRKTARSAAVGA